MSLFQELNRQGMTIVLVTHEPDIARFSGRVLRFLDGHVIGDEANAPADARRLLGAEALAA
jgi:putative ABC transport system ATP-binding protein